MRGPASNAISLPVGEKVGDEKEVTGQSASGTSSVDPHRTRTRSLAPRSPLVRRNARPPELVIGDTSPLPAEKV